LSGASPRKGFSWGWRVVALSAVAGAFAATLAADEAIYAYVHQNFNHATRPVPDLLKLPHRLLRCAEDWGENVFIVCVAFAMWRFDRSRRSRVLMLFVAAAATACAVEGLKRATGRERPDSTGGRSVFHGPARWRAGGEYQSFPSGHAAAGASFSGSLSAYYPPLRPVAIALAVGCAGNRIWKERHFASDCFASLALGLGIGFWLPRSRWARPIRRWFDGAFSEVEDESAKAATAPRRAVGVVGARRPLATGTRFP
jgi:membrane-associated PAP2 superfamily phosphatase